MDNSGKTTLIKELSEAFNRKIVKSPGPKRYREMFDFVDMYLTQMETLRSEEITTEYPFIHDRFPVFSDQVYSLLRAINPFNDLDEGKWLQERLYKVKPILVYCRPTTDVILNFKDGREQMEGVQKNAKELLQRYDHIMFQWNKRMGSCIYQYSYEEHSANWMVDNLIERGYEKLD